MKTPLNKVKKRINCEEYSLQEMALFFEQYDGYVLLINTTNLTIKIKIDKNSLPHLLEVHYAYINFKNKNDFKGAKGFEKLKNGIITLEMVKNNIKTRPNILIGWKNIKRRFEFLPMFLNTITKNTRLKTIDLEKMTRNILLKGNYLFFKQVREENKIVFPMMSIKK